MWPPFTVIIATSILIKIVTRSCPWFYLEPNECSLYLYITFCCIKSLLIVSCHLIIRLVCDLFHSYLLNAILFAFLVSTVSATFSSHLILSVPSSRVKESNKKPEKQCFLLIIHGEFCSMHRQISHGSSTALDLYSEEGPFKSKLNYRQSWVLSEFSQSV
jgi:hypothetical protein